MRLAHTSKQVIRRLLNQHYLSARLYYHIGLNRKIKKSKLIVLVYQMGKVGSSSVVRSLNAINILTFNVHTFNPLYLKGTERTFRKLYVANGPLPRTLWDQEFFFRLIKKGVRSDTIKIVTLVRDPVARNISHFFQYPNMIMEKVEGGYHIHSRRYRYDRVVNEQNIQEELQELFCTRMDNHEQALTWLDDELRCNFGIDVYSEEFPQDKGYAIYRNTRTEVLLIKLEKLNEVFCDSMREFMGIEAIELIQENIGTDKKTGSLYEQFLKAFKVPETYMELLYNSRFTTHFYSTAEISRFREKWRR